MQRTLALETKDAIGKRVTLAGWIHVRRNLGKMVFFDLRDRSGTVQVICVPNELDAASQSALEEIRPEFVVQIEGTVKERGGKNANAESPTGSVEVLASSVVVLSSAKTPPFEITNEDRQANEEL